MMPLRVINRVVLPRGVGGGDTNSITIQPHIGRLPEGERGVSETLP